MLYFLGNGTFLCQIKLDHYHSFFCGKLTLMMIIVYKQNIAQGGNMRSLYEKLIDGLTLKKILLIVVGAMIATFGIHNIHQRTNITEGGVIGLMLLIEHWLNISPAYITPILDISCYILAYKFLGGDFIKISFISTTCVSLFYKFWELFPPMLPDLSEYPLLAALLGGMFVGVGVGLIVRQGGSSGGDDALALIISHVSGWKLARCYLFTDVTVLLLSLSYIPVLRIIYSLITVTISSYLIDWVRELKVKEKSEIVQQEER